jgi:2-polyprenyl-6-methoxyphenol hydroxylase-like FAD-dependent oxidoreductase
MPGQTRPTVLVTGTSVAGPTLAWGLDRAGFDVTLLERSPVPRTTGQNVDVRGLGRDVLRRLGVEDEVLAHLAGEDGTRFIGQDGEPVAVLPKKEGADVDGPTAEVEILRGRLSEILLGTLPASVEQRWGTYVSAVVQDADGVDVTLADGTRERFDLLLVAEGRGSRTRGLVLGDRVETRDAGVSMAYGTIDRRPDDTDFWDWYTALRGRSITLRPDDVGTIRATLTFSCEPFGFEELDTDAQLTVLRERFAGAGWQTERVLDGFEQHPEELYASRFAQVVLPTWSEGRVAFLGDAAWGSGPTGTGTTLALVGAYVLAGELERTLHEDGRTHRDAFEAYESQLRDYVDHHQSLPPGGARVMHPSSRLGVGVLNTVFRLAASRPLSALLQSRFLPDRKGEPTLADYPFARREGRAAA